MQARVLTYFMSSSVDAKEKDKVCEKQRDYQMSVNRVSERSNRPKIKSKI